MSSPPTRETAMSVALQEAQDRKRQKRAEDKAKRAQVLEGRLEALRAKSTGERTKPAPQRPKWETDQPYGGPEDAEISIEALSKAIGAPLRPTRQERPRMVGHSSTTSGTPDRDAAERSERLREIANRQSPAATKPPFADQRRPVEPSVAPPAPDDPRVTNGTLAPSPRVAEVLKTTVAPPPHVAPERPLQTASVPEEYARILETGTPAQILAGRNPADLKGEVRHAYYRAMGRAGVVAKMNNPDRKPVVRSPRAARGKYFDETPFALKVLRLRLKRGLTVVQLAEKSGISKSALTRIYSGPGRYMSEETIRCVAKGLGIQASILLNLEGALRPTAGEPGTAAGAATAPRIAPDGTAIPRTPREVLAGRKLRDLNVAEKNEYHVALGYASVKARRARGDARPFVRKPKGDAPRVAAAPAPTADTSEAFPRSGAAGLERLTAPRATDTPFMAALRGVMRDRCLTSSDVGRLTGLGNDIAAALLRGNRVPSSYTVAKLCQGLGVSQEDLKISTMFLRVPKTSPAPMPEPVVSVEPSESARVFAPVPEIEKGIPVPAFFLSREMYNFEGMERGDSFLAECPFGMAWPDFRHRFASMVSNVQKRTKHWYTTEDNATNTGIRVWRVV